MAWSVQSDLQAQTRSRVAREEFASSGLFAGIKVAGIRVWQVLRVGSEESRSKA